MDCRKIEDQGIIERYLAARLSEQETEAFEQHYLECQQCFQELKLRHATAIELRSQPMPLRPARTAWTPFSWRWALASAVVALFVLAGVFYLRPVEQPRAPGQTAAIQQPSDAVLEQLTSIDRIPPYIPGLIRGAQTNKALMKFQEGMDLYSMQKYSEAIVPLAEAARLDDRQIIAFYLGISYLVSGNTGRAIEQLSKVTAQENPYSEEGHWFLAKAYLKQRDFRSARMELQAVESLRGAYSARAQDLLQQIQNF